MYPEVIVYQTSAGTTRRYAERLSQLSGLPAVSLKMAKRECAGSPALFMSWICSGVLMNYEKAAGVLNICGVAAVGIGKEETARADLKRHQQLEGSSLFFLPGIFDMKKLGFFQRRTMKDMEYALAMRVRGSRGAASQADRDTYDMLRNGLDCYDETLLQPILRWIQGR